MNTGDFDPGRGPSIILQSLREAAAMKAQQHARQGYGNPAGMLTAWARQNMPWMMGNPFAGLSGGQSGSNYLYDPMTSAVLSDKIANFFESQTKDPIIASAEAKYGSGARPGAPPGQHPTSPAFALNERMRQAEVENATRNNILGMIMPLQNQWTNQASQSIAGFQNNLLSAMGSLEGMKAQTLANAGQPILNGFEADSWAYGPHSGSNAQSQIIGDMGPLTRSDKIQDPYSYNRTFERLNKQLEAAIKARKAGIDNTSKASEYS